jgi:hypothetical protein
VSSDKIRDEIVEVENALKPATKDAAAVLLAPLSDLFAPPSTQAAAIYLTTLSDMPAWALALAVDRCLRECRFFPAPAEIRERAQELHRAQRAKIKLGVALWVLERERRG